MWLIVYYCSITSAFNPATEEKYANNKLIRIQYFDKYFIGQIRVAISTYIEKKHLLSIKEIVFFSLAKIKWNEISHEYRAYYYVCFKSCRTSACKLNYCWFLLQPFLSNWRRSKQHPKKYFDAGAKIEKWIETIWMKNYFHSSVVLLQERAPRLHGLNMLWIMRSRFPCESGNACSLFNLKDEIKIIILCAVLHHFRLISIS